MRRLIVQEFVTLDGRAAGPNGETDFIPMATEGDGRVAETQMRFIDRIDTIVLGRVTYQMFAGYWPTATGDDKPFADKLNAIRRSCSRRRSIVLRGVPGRKRGSAETTHANRFHTGGEKRVMIWSSGGA
jgi:dihydrofolate reductase